MAVSGTSAKLKSGRARHSVSDGHQTTSGTAEEVEVVATETGSAVVLEIKNTTGLGALVKVDGGPDHIVSKSGSKVTISAL